MNGWFGFNDVIIFPSRVMGLHFALTKSFEIFRLAWIDEARFPFNFNQTNIMFGLLCNKPFDLHQNIIDVYQTLTISRFYMFQSCSSFYHNKLDFYY